VARDRVTGERVHGVERRRGVARPAAQPRAHRNALRQLDRHTELPVRRIEDDPRRPHRQVVLHGTEVGPLHGQRDAAAVRGPAHDQLVGQLEQRERGLDLVVPGRRFPRQDAEQQVELRVGRDTDALGGRRHGRQSSASAAARSSARCRRMRDSEYSPSRVMGTNVVRW